MWPFRRRHDPNDAPAVEEARQVRDDLFDELDNAIQKVDQVQDRISADYEAAEKQRRVRRAR